MAEWHVIDVDELGTEYEEPATYDELTAEWAAEAWAEENHSYHEYPPKMDCWVRPASGGEWVRFRVEVEWVTSCRAVRTDEEGTGDA